MKFQPTALISVASLALACQAIAQTSLPTQPQPSTVQPAEPDSTRLALAKQLVEAVGQERQAEATMKILLEATTRQWEHGMTPVAARFAKPMYDEMTLEFVQLTPRILEKVTRLYAETFTEKELRDLIAFWTSDTGRASMQKAPLIAQKLSDELPSLADVLVPILMRHATERICAEKHCTPEEHRALTDTMARAVAGRAG